MGTTAEKLEYTKNSINKIGNSIKAKVSSFITTQPLDTWSSEIDKIGGGGGSTIIPKTITANGTYSSIDDGADGYNPVTVNVSGGGGGAIDRDTPKIIWQYIDTTTGEWKLAMTNRTDYTPPPAGNVNAFYFGAKGLGDLKSPALNFTGWSITEEDLTIYSEEDDLLISAVYKTSDNKTYLKLYLSPSSTNTIPINITMVGTGTLTITDKMGTVIDTLTSTKLVNYTSPVVSGIEWIILTYEGTGTWSNNNTLIGYGSTIKASLREAYFGNGIEEISASCFSSCTGMKIITLPSEVTIVNANSFKRCNSLFYFSSKLLSMVGASIFSECYNLKYFTIPKSTITIEEQCFYNCHCLENISFPNSLEKTNGTFCFSGCGSLKKIIFNEGFTSISSDCFSNSLGLSEVIFSETFTVIGTNAFNGIKSFTNIVITPNITTIGNYAFNLLTSLNTLTFTRSTPPNLVNVQSIASIPVSSRVYVPYGKLSTYKSATNYASFSNRMIEDTKTNRDLYGDEYSKYTNMEV